MYWIEDKSNFCDVLVIKNGRAYLVVGGPGKLKIFFQKF
jgi:hypothetical protein